MLSGNDIGLCWLDKDLNRKPDAELPAVLLWGVSLYAVEAAGREICGCPVILGGFSFVQETIEA